MKRSFSIFFSTGLLLAALGSCGKPPGEAEYDRGVAELRRGHAVRAKAYFEKSIARRPGSERNALAYNYLGVADWKLGRFQEAQEAFEDSRRISPALAEPVLNLALLQRDGGDRARALKLLEEAARIDPSDSRALEQAASMYAEQKQWVEARRALYAALDRAPQHPRILTAIALVDLASSGPLRAIESLVAALERDSRYAPALFNLAAIYDVRLGDADHARAYYQRFLKQEPAGPRADQARAVLARLATARAAPQAAPVSEVAAPSAVPVPAEVPPPDPVEQLLRAAAALADAGDTDQALERCLRAAEKAEREGRAGEQEKILREAARLCFDKGNAHYALGRLLRARGDEAGALASFRAAAKLDQSDAALQLDLARAAVRAGEADTALVSYQAAVRLNARNADSLWELAVLLDETLRNSERALQAYREFDRLFPNDPRHRQAGERIRDLTPPPEPVRSEPAPEPKPEPIIVPSPPRPVAVPPRAPSEPAPLRAKQQIVYTPPARPDAAAALAAFNQGATLQHAGRLKEAMLYYLRALERDDRSATTFYNLGSAHAAMGETELAKDAYLRALQLDPDQSAARYNLAGLYYRERDLATARRVLEEVVRRSPDHAAGYYFLGQVCAQLPDGQTRAAEAYREFLRLGPKEPAAPAVRRWLETN